MPTTKEETMAKKDATTLPADAQAALLDDPDMIREILRAALQEILEAEMTGHVGAKPYERTESRIGQRNGYKPRTLTMRVGTLTLHVPQDRDGSFLNEAVRPLPANRESARAGAHGDVRRGRVDPQGRTRHRRAVRHDV
jgi:hypothetical protein